jgi:hypothetical protein
VNGGLYVQSGDTLLLAVPNNNMSMEEFERLRERLKEYLPGVELAVFTGVSQFAVYRPDDISTSKEQS